MRYCGTLAFEAVHTSVERAVKARLVSDVPIGAFLSGGIDSTIVVGIMAYSLDASDMVRDVPLSADSLTRDYFRPQGVKALIVDQANGNRRSSALVWALLVLELWHRTVAASESLLASA